MNEPFLMTCNVVCYLQETKLNQTNVVDATSNQTLSDAGGNNSSGGANYRLVIGLSCVLCALVLLAILIVYLKWKSRENADTNTPNVLFQRAGSIIRFQKGGRDVWSFLEKQNPSNKLFAMNSDAIWYFNNASVILEAVVKLNLFFIHVCYYKVHFCNGKIILF